MKPLIRCHFLQCLLWPACCNTLHYLVYYMYLDRQPWVNSVDPDKPHNVASHQGLHYLSLISNFLTYHWDVCCTCSNFITSMVRSWGVQILRVNTIIQYLSSAKLNLSTLQTRQKGFAKCINPNERACHHVSSGPTLFAVSVFEFRDHSSYLGMNCLNREKLKSNGYQGNNEILWSQM